MKEHDVTFAIGMINVWIKDQVITQQRSTAIKAEEINLEVDERANLCPCCLGQRFANNILRRKSTKPFEPLWPCPSCEDWWPEFKTGISEFIPVKNAKIHNKGK